MYLELKNESFIEKIKIIDSINFILTKIFILLALMYNYDKSILKLDSAVNYRFNKILKSFVINY